MSWQAMLERSSGLTPSTSKGRTPSHAWVHYDYMKCSAGVPSHIRWYPAYFSQSPFPGKLTVEFVAYTNAHE